MVASLANFHDLHAIVSHPRDAEGELFIRSLQRLGTKVECQWPPAATLDRKTDFLICNIEPAARALLEIATATPGPAVLGIMDAHSSESLRLAGEVTPHAIIVRPVDPAAIVPNLVLARSNAKYQQRQQSKIAKLEETLRSYRKVEQAKTILNAPESHRRARGVQFLARASYAPPRTGRGYCLSRCGTQ